MTLQLDKRQPGVIDSLMALTGIALTLDMEAIALPMLEVARKFRPESPRLDSFEGWFCLRRGDMTGAVRHLSKAVDELGDQAGSARSLLAMVLCAQGDPAWLTHAETVIARNEDPSSVYLMKAMRGDPDAMPFVSENAGEAVESGAEEANTATPELVQESSEDKLSPVPNVAGRNSFLKG